jgi:predicted enzyme related to lactoylglutathione lyase
MLSLAFLKVPVTDLNRAVTFYTKALPLNLAFAAEEYGWAQLEAGELSLALYVPGKGGGNRTPGGSVDFQLHHPDLDALLATFKDNLPDVKAEIFENNDGSRSLEFTDPDSNELKILSM